MKLTVLYDKIIYFLLRVYQKGEKKNFIRRAAINMKKAPVKFHSLSITCVDGRELHFSEFSGKYVLLVNTASACGYTAQYAYLEKLSRQFETKLVILGFPSNDFGKQEPGSNEDIRIFCKDTYHITFPLSEKSNVIGKNMNPVYQWLSKSERNGWNNREPGWNFCKYLVDVQGELIAFYSEKINPMQDVITRELI